MNGSDGSLTHHGMFYHGNMTDGCTSIEHKLCVMIRLPKRGFSPAAAWENPLLYLTGGLMMAVRLRERLFANYPDVVSVEQMCAMLGGIGKKTAYDLLKAGEIRYLKIGKSFKIPKISVIEYLIDSD